MFMYGHRAFLDRAHLSKNWIFDFYAFLLLGSQNLDWDRGKKTTNPRIILIQDNSINVFYSRAKNLRNL